MPAQEPNPTSSTGSASPLSHSDRPIPPSLLAGCVLAWLGTLISLLLLERHAGIRAFLCPDQGGCETVLTSRYSAPGGVPLPLLGMAFYLVMLGLLLVVYANPSKGARLRLLERALWMAVAGLTFSVGLMYLQFGVLRAFCPLCTSSAVVMAGLLAAIVRARRVMEAGDWGASSAGALTLAIFAILPATILATSGLASPERRAGRWLDLSTAQIAGPRDARVQLVVFSDFQCHFCRQFAPVLKRIRDEFPQEVMVAYRYFPLKAHDRAVPAAVAAECAADQGEFWKYHDQLFTGGGDLSDAQLLAMAAAIGLDQERFAQCLKSGKSKKRVEDSRDDAINSGLKGVPAVFLNGRRVEGALDYDHLVRQIRALLP